MPQWPEDLYPEHGQNLAQRPEQALGQTGDGSTCAQLSPEATSDYPADMPASRQKRYLTVLGSQGPIQAQGGAGFVKWSPVCGSDPAPPSPLSYRVFPHSTALCDTTTHGEGTVITTFYGREEAHKGAGPMVECGDIDVFQESKEQKEKSKSNRNEPTVVSVRRQEEAQTVGVTSQNTRAA